MENFSRLRSLSKIWCSFSSWCNFLGKNSRFDQTVQGAMKISGSEDWNVVFKEMQAQLYYLAGTLLLKRAQQVMRPEHRYRNFYPALALLLFCATFVHSAFRIIWAGLMQTKWQQLVSRQVTPASRRRKRLHGLRSRRTRTRELSREW